MILAFLIVPALFILAILVIMVWGAIANLIHVSKIVWRFFYYSMISAD